ncbi:glutamic acid-rich protein-like [Phalaenopsis equestris]|uniref:glutamic acid-rich protein-like n=1 Tax=Phalaenopsis equestris TaxID=78828 RepID=UPI0009E2F42D|nr:glutamic acid-rich protein-like [Phalaenopsis equestris]
MELLSRSESRGTAAAAAELVLISVVDTMLMGTILGAGKFLLWLLCMIGSSQNGANLFDEGSDINKGFPLSSLRKLKDESVPENKDDGESDDDEEEDEDEVGDQDDDGGEEDYSGEEGNEEDEDELEANGAEGSDDEDGDEDDEDEDGDEDDEDEDEDAEDEDDDEDQPPPKKKK